MGRDEGRNRWMEGGRKGGGREDEGSKKNRDRDRDTEKMESPFICEPGSTFAVAR